ncbi:MAG: carboxypeptidase-like regulatory domain-containing protein, partial [Chitinophagaceae bacterium]|nr:carboxypeptidase-like regulatory domain-containing protein [Chitinophagaceae bacterium]
MNLKPCFKTLRVFLFSTLLMFFTANAFSQSKKVAGKVVDETGNGIANVTVTVKGTKLATQTDAGGNYSLDAAENAILLFSSVGFAASEASTKGKNLVDVTLTSQVNKLNEVVLVGYGTQRKADLTGAVGSISKKDFANKPFTSPDQILTGRMAGVNVTN